MNKIMKKMKNKGFTIIELVVVIAVFLFIIGAALSIFIYIFKHQRRVLKEQQLVNQISYVQEYMSKALRAAKVATSDACTGTGYIYLLTNYDSGTGVYKGIKFLRQDDSGADLCQEFFVENESAGDFNTPLVLKEIKGNRPAIAITSKDLNLDPENPARFAINGTDGSLVSLGCSQENPLECGATSEDPMQPRITIMLGIKDIDGVAKTIQTTVSQRNLNLK